MPDSPDSTKQPDQSDAINYDGFEIRVGDVLSYRRGSITDDGNYIDGSTEGWGLSLLGWAGVDYAKVPYFRGLKDERWSIWARFPLDWL
jgi:hypothetical protein